MRHLLLRTWQIFFGIIGIVLLICEAVGFFLPQSGFAIISKHFGMLCPAGLLGAMLVEMTIQNKRLRGAVK